MKNRTCLDWRCCLMLSALTFLLAGVADGGDSNSLMDISSDGRILACSNRDSGTVSFVDLTTGRKTFEIAVGSKPEGVSFLGNSHQLAVAVYGDDKVALLDASKSAGQSIAVVEVFDEPYGVVSSADGKRIYVTLDYPGRVVEIDVQTRKVLRQFNVGKFVRGIAIAEKEARLYVTEFYTSALKAVDLKTGKVVDQWNGASTDNLARQVVLNPRRPKAYLTHIRSRVTANHGSGSIFPYLSVVDTGAGEGKRRTRIPVDSAFSTQVTANPWEVAISPDGRNLYLVFGGTNDMFALRVIDDDYREVDLQRHMRLGANPRAVRVAPDGKTFYVYQALDFNVVAFDAVTLRQTARFEVTENPLSKIVLTGKRLFYTALAPMASRRWISCSSCHPDGQPDGRTWQNPEGLRNTQSLGGMAWTHPIHWSADRDEVQDFEHTIRGPLMQGRGLLRGRLNGSLKTFNRGLSSDLDALAAYANSHDLPVSPYAKNGLTEAAKRGQKLFFSEATRCATCHKGAFFTDSTPGPADKLVRHDVGTGGDDETEKMGPAYDTPTLLGVYRTAPYLHHGAAPTLLDVLTTKNQGDHHGGTSQLTADELQDLVEFLKSLPYEDPIKAARKSGMSPVE